MNEPRRSPDTDSAKRLQLRGLARRAVIASYIHELSERHSGANSQEAERAT
jgi:hypothetical protein